MLQSFFTQKQDLFYLEDGNFVVIIPTKTMSPSLTHDIKVLFEKTWGSDPMKLNFPVQIHSFDCPEHANSIEALIDLTNSVTYMEERLLSFYAPRESAIRKNRTSRQICIG